MSKTRPDLIKETGGDVIQEAFYPAVAQNVAIGSSSLRNSTDFTSMIIEVIPTVDCFFELGDDTVIVTSGEDHFLKANLSKRLNVRENTRIAVQQKTSGEIGVLYISELS